MRQIKFRAWDTFNEKMVDEPYRFRPSGENDLLYAKGDKRYDAPFQYYESWQDEDDGINRPCYIMQLTGLKDKNGTDIYEGDIVSYNKATTAGAKRKQKEFKAIVIWRQHSASFELDDIDETGKYKTSFNGIDNSIVIGNIHQHPELINSQV